MLYHYYHFLLLIICWRRTTAFQIAKHSISRHARRAERGALLWSNASSSSSSGAAEVDPVSRLPLMEAELDALLLDDDGGVENEYDDHDDLGSLTRSARREELKERVQQARTAAELGVRRVQVDFYDAFTRQDLDAMAAVWSDGDNVRCVHPGGESVDGKEAILRSWATIFQGEAFDIDPSRVVIEICGRTALCSCVENTPGGGRLEALNVYRREKGKWCMTLHMASPIFTSMM